jgi:His/Glu/Gln/Arg/opine family amino acid ABC transporter permease subunit
MTFDPTVVEFGLPILLKGLVNTLVFCSISIFFGLNVAVLIALGRLSQRRLFYWVATAYVEIIRNTPFLIQAFLVFFGLPALGIRVGATFAGILVLTLYGSAYFAESMRGAILSVPKGQMEAARVLGMTYSRAMRRIVYPQTLGYLIPSLGNQVIGVIKDSAALSVITVPEMAMAAQVVVGQTFSPVETYVMVALLYWMVTAVLAGLIAISERRLSKEAH